MSKINIKTTLINPEETQENKTKGIMIDNKLLYDENNSKISIELEDDSVKMITRSIEHILELVFKEGNTTGKYTLISENAGIDVEIFTKLLQISKNYIKINYIFNDEERTYEIEYEEIL